MLDNNNKFNIIMPETDDHVLCVQIEKLITKTGYENNFLRRLDEIIEVHERARILVYYKDYQGWEEGAAARDLSAAEEYRGKIERVAFVNAPKKEKALSSYRATAVTGEIRFFSDQELEQALVWVKS